jgi:glutamate N-acetyltransferase / amino-acid N-acetyltransferase
MMAGDGEGATALIEVKVINADTKENAKLLSKSVVGSSLTKAAIYGHDSNWGRILCALGYSGAQFNPNIVDIAYEGNGKKIQVCQKSMMVDYSEAEATEILSSPEVTILVNMNAGTASATAWGCDLTYDYVKINADYRS